MTKQNRKVKIHILAIIEKVISFVKRQLALLVNIFSISVCPCNKVSVFDNDEPDSETSRLLVPVDFLVKNGQKIYMEPLTCS